MVRASEESSSTSPRVPTALFPGPDGSVDWLERPRPKSNYRMGAFYKSIDTILWGRKTYDMAFDFQKKGVTGRPSQEPVRNAGDFGFVT